MSLQRSPPGKKLRSFHDAMVLNPSPSSRQLRITPRNSDADDVIASAVGEETPYGTLRQLANFPKPTTPLRRASSAGPPSHRSTRRTPTAHAKTPGAGQRLGGSARRPNALTPHGRAAMREVEARRAGLTPGQDRRRSGRQQRETPRDNLRLLSRLMAPKTQPVVPTPQGSALIPRRFNTIEIDDLDDGPDPDRPQLSLPLDEDEDENDSLLLPPRSAGLEDENFTAHSIELPRRAISEQPPGRLSRGSLGSIRMSDQFVDLNEFGLGGVFDSSYAMGDALEDDDGLELADGVHVDNIGSPRDIDYRRGRLSLASGRDSDIRLGTVLVDDTENTFAFTVPPRDVPITQSVDASPEFPVVDDNENNDWEEKHRVVADDSGFDSQPDDTIGILESTLQDVDTSAIAVTRISRKKKVKISKYGIRYPSLPVGVVRKLATQYARTGGSRAKISKDTLDAITQASDWFLEQIGDDLSAYSEHAGRKTIDESDIITLMKRQRQINPTTTPFSLAQRFLPRELLQELRMAPPSKLNRGRPLEQVEEVAED